MPIDGPLMAIDGSHGTAMAIDEMRWDLSTAWVLQNVTKVVRRSGKRESDSFVVILMHFHNTNI